MPRPQWLLDLKAQEQYIKVECCKNCQHFGRPVRKTKHKGDEACYVHECAIHEGCLNTRFSLCCEDFEPIR